MFDVCDFVFVLISGLFVLIWCVFVAGCFVCLLL